jgi:hypothetical protein
MRPTGHIVSGGTGFGQLHFGPGMRPTGHIVFGGVTGTGHIVSGGTGVGQLRCPRLVLGAIAARACASPTFDDVPHPRLRAGATGAIPMAAAGAVGGVR